VTVTLVGATEHGSVALGALACWTIYAVTNARCLRARPHFTSREWSMLTGIATGALSLVLVVPAVLITKSPRRRG
jgi:drug/metabolite transporter (DMT)-like permease